MLILAQQCFRTELLFFIRKRKSFDFEGFLFQFSNNCSQRVHVSTFAVLCCHCSSKKIIITLWPAATYQGCMLQWSLLLLPSSQFFLSSILQGSWEHSLLFFVIVSSPSSVTNGWVVQTQTRVKVRGAERLFSKKKLLFYQCVLIRTRGLL